MYRQAVVRSKHKVVDVPYKGVLYPEQGLRDVPERDNDNVVLRDDLGRMWYLRAVPLDADAAVDAAEPYSLQRSGCVDMLEQPLRDRALALRAFPTLSQTVTTLDGEELSRGRWIGHGILHSRPGPLSSDQTEQLLRGAYWSLSSNATDQERAEGARVVGYYEAAGYAVVTRRPYRRRR